MASLKKNVIYSSILTTANYLFPLLTYPYVSRVLGVDNIGICNFVDSIINYFILFSVLGLNTIAIREIAKNKDNKAELSSTFSSIIFLNTITTGIALLVLIVSIFLVPDLNCHKELMFMGAFKLIFNYLLIEWLYKGLEDFRYITIRSVIIRTLYVASVFIFVRDSSDYVIYYLLSVLTIVINAIINLGYSRKLVSITFRNINIRTLLVPFFTLGFYQILTSFHTTFNVVYLGFVSGTTEVGFFTTATKIHALILSMFTAFTGVMLPRMSALSKAENRTEFLNLIGKSINVLLLFSIPVFFIVLIYAPDIISIISGSGYENAVPCLRIISPLVFIIGYEQILIIQVLLAKNNDRAVLINSAVSAIITILMNVIIVPELGAQGSSVIWLLSELTVLLMAQYFVHRYENICFPWKLFVRHFLYAIPVFSVCIGLSAICTEHYIALLISAIAIISYYLVLYILILKEPLIINIIKRRQ